MASSTLSSATPSQLCASRSALFCPSQALLRKPKSAQMGAKGKGVKICCQATSISADRVPDMGKRKTMNLLLLGAIGLPTATMLYPYTYFFVPPGTGGAGGGIVAKDAFGNDVHADEWLKAHGPGDRTLTQGLKGDPTYLVVEKDKTLATFGINAVCTHLGCVVPWNAAENKFICPCHGSQYNDQGRVVRGPAPLSRKRPMDYSAGNWNWLFDYSTMDDLAVAAAAAAAGNFSPPQSVGFSWSNPSINFSSKDSLEVDCSYGDQDGLQEVGRKRPKTETGAAASSSKACREKLRRDKLNESFLELAAVLEPGKPPKTDKVAILSDAIRMVTDLQSETQKLKQSKEDLKAKIKELKVEKNELRDEKQRLRAEKEKLELQIKGVNTRAADIHRRPPTLSPAFTAQGQAAGNKLMPFIGYPGIAMWQFLPPAAVDISQDHVLRPPVA